MKKILAGVIILLVPLAAAEAKFRFGPAIGVYQGTGFVIQSGSTGTNVELACGYVPLIIVVTGYREEVRWVHTADISGGVFQTFGEFGKKFRPAAIFSLHYNTSLGMGLGGAFKGILVLKKMEVNVNAGLKFYFNGKKNILDKQNLDEVDFLGTSLVIGLGAGLLF